MYLGTMVFDQMERLWVIWIGKNKFETFTGMDFEICIDHRFYRAMFEKDYFDYIVTIEDNVDFTLRPVETYTVLMFERELVPAEDLPF